MLHYRNMDAGFEYKRISAAGTTVIRAIPSTLHVVAPSVSVGTIDLYDIDTAAGTAATNRVYSFTGGTAVQDCMSIPLDIQFKKGIVAQAVGTPVALLAVS